MEYLGCIVLFPRNGEVPEWLKGADCKSVGLRLRWFESIPLHQRNFRLRESSRAEGQHGCPARLTCCNSRHPLMKRAHVAQW